MVSLSNEQPLLPSMDSRTRVSCDGVSVERTGLEDIKQRPLD